MTHKYLQKNDKIYKGPDAEIYCQSCYSFEFGTKARTKPKKGFKKLVVIFLKISITAYRVPHVKL